MGALGLTGARCGINGILLLTLALTGCALGGPAKTGAEPAPTAVPPTQARPLVIFFRVEPPTVATRALVQSGVSPNVTRRIFNALPALLDARGVPQPELLASLSALNTDSWRVFPDSTMQTTYTLRPNLTWHDGQPLTSDDFVFAGRVYTDKELGFASQPPMPAISEIAATDREHFVIHWKVPYPDAGHLSVASSEFAPLPQHILGPAFDQIATTGRDAFANHPFWGPQYVGLGPYRLQEWQAGSFIDAIRFDGYVLGIPKIARIQLRFSADQNVVMASLLAGEAHVATAGTISENPETLRQQWNQTSAGSIFQSPSSWRGMSFQLRRELANPPAILDHRVRKAVAHAVDKQAINDAVYAGGKILADTPVWTGSAWGDAVDSSMLTYPLDLRATESLMNQVGVSKGTDGFYRGSDGRLSLEVAALEGPDSARELLVVADRLGAAGLEVRQRVVPPVQVQDAQVRATFTAVFITSSSMGEPVLQSLASTQIGTPANRWLGGNLGAWSSPDYDRLLKAFNTSLDRAERVVLVREMLRLYSEELPWISLFFTSLSTAFVAGLKGPAPVAPESTVAWNIHEWEFS